MVVVYYRKLTARVHPDNLVPGDDAAIDFLKTLEAFGKVAAVEKVAGIGLREGFDLANLLNGPKKFYLSVRAQKRA
jgi:hypothetical protein